MSCSVLSKYDLRTEEKKINKFPKTFLILNSFVRYNNKSLTIINQFFFSSTKLLLSLSSSTSSDIHVN